MLNGLFKAWKARSTQLFLDRRYVGLHRQDWGEPDLAQDKGKWSRLEASQRRTLDRGHTAILHSTLQHTCNSRHRRGRVMCGGGRPPNRRGSRPG
jgi:hypothetical protein